MLMTQLQLRHTVISLVIARVIAHPMFRENIDLKKKTQSDCLPLQMQGDGLGYYGQTDSS